MERFSHVTSASAARTILLCVCFLYVFFSLPHCAATAGQAPNTVRLELDSLEAIQIVQDSLGRVPLIAGRPTLIRAFFTNYSEERLGITAELKLVRDGNQVLPNIQPTTSPIPFYLVSDNNSFDLVRARLGLTLNFLIPETQATEGGVDVSLAIAKLVGKDNNPHDFRCDSCNKIKHLVFEKDFTFRVRVVAFSYASQAAGGLRSPSEADKAAVVSWLQRTFPVGNFDISVAQATLNDSPEIHDCISRNWVDRDDNHACCIYVNSQLLSLRKKDQPNGAPIHYYGLVPETATGDTIRGCANLIPMSYDFEAVASGPGGAMTDSHGNDIPEREARCKDKYSIAGCYAIHEVGHLLGRQHPGACPPLEQRDDLCFPFDSGQLSPPNDYIGLDIGNLDLKTMRLVPAVSHDMMTYCYQPWPSAYTLRALRKSIECENRFTVQDLPFDCEFDSHSFIDNALGPELRAQGCNPLAAGGLSEVRDRLAPVGPTGTSSAQGVRFMPIGVANVAAVAADEKTQVVSTEATKPTIEGGGISLVASVDLRQRKAKIMSLTQLVSVPKPPPDSGKVSKLRVVVKNQAGEVQVSAPAILRRDSELPASDVGLISVDLPITNDSSAVEVLIDDQVAERRELAGKFGDFTIDQPEPVHVNHKAGPSDAGRTITLSWHVAKEDAAKGITFSIQRNDSDADVWQTLVTDVAAEQVTLPALPTTSQTRFRIIATNGVYTIVKTFKLPANH